MRMDSMRPPVLNPNVVPRSYTVKLDVPPAAHLLPLLLRLGVLVILVLGHERDVGGDDGTGHVGGERELLLGAIVHVVEEDAAFRGARSCGA